MSRNLRDRDDANRFANQQYHSWRDDELLRIRRRYEERKITADAMFVEIVASLRKLKSALILKLNSMKHTDWIDNSSAFLDIKIEETIALRDKLANPPKKKAKKKKMLWLPFRTKPVEPPEAN